MLCIARGLFSALVFADVVDGRVLFEKEMEEVSFLQRAIAKTEEKNVKVELIKETAEGFVELVAGTPREDPCKKACYQSRATGGGQKSFDYTGTDGQKHTLVCDCGPQGGAQQTVQPRPAAVQPGQRQPAGPPDCSQGQAVPDPNNNNEECGKGAFSHCARDRMPNSDGYAFKCLKRDEACVSKNDTGASVQKMHPSQGYCFCVSDPQGQYRPCP